MSGRDRCAEISFNHSQSVEHSQLRLLLISGIAPGPESGSQLKEYLTRFIFQFSGKHNTYLTFRSTMPRQPLRRSKRIAATTKVVVDEENKHAVRSKVVVAKTTRRARSRVKNCSLQSLEPLPRKSQNNERKALRAPSTLKTRNKKSSSSTRTATCRRVTLSPAAKPKSRRLPIVLPSIARAQSKRVTFDLRCNSFAEYTKENPPSVVKRLPHNPSEVHFITTHVIEDDETTRRNAEVLGEWESNFEDFDGNDE